MKNSTFSLSEVNAIIETTFADVVGMHDAKKRVADNIRCNAIAGKNLLSATALAPAGTGKSKFCIAWQSALAKLGFETLHILPSQVRKLGSKWDETISFLTNDTARRSLFIDEGHEIFASGRTVQLAKLGSLAMSALDGNRPDCDAIPFSDEISVRFHRAEFNLILATNFPGKMPQALAGKDGRCPQIILPLYTEEQSAEIAHKMLAKKGIRACEDSLRALGRVARGTARPLEHLTAQLETIATLARKETVNKTDILSAMISCGLFPLGFNRAEIDVLHFLQTPNIQSTLAARFPHLDVQTLREFFGHALGNGLIGKTNGGMTLTTAGRRYFVESAKIGFPLPALAK